MPKPYTHNFASTTSHLGDDSVENGPLVVQWFSLRANSLFASAYNEARQNNTTKIRLLSQEEPILNAELLAEPQSITIAN